MKKLMMAAFVAGSMVVLTAPAAESAAAAAPAAEQSAVTAKKARRTPMTPEERKARLAKMVADRRAKAEAKAVEIIKKYGLDEEKAKALFNELQSAMKGGFGRRAAKRPAPKAE